MTVLSQLTNFFYPPRCLVCQKAGAIVHSACQGRLPYLKEPFCHRCSQSVLNRQCRSSLCTMSEERRALTGVRSVFWHEGGGREAVLRLKYRGVASLREWAGSESAQALSRFGLADYFAVVIPVPLHPARLRQRGYSQSAIVARPLARRLGLAYRPQSLVRTKDTRSQVSLSGHERAGNVRDAFDWVGPKLTGQHVLLFDDVCTTGATLNECARALQKAGAGEIWALTLTRETILTDQPNNRNFK